MSTPLLIPALCTPLHEDETLHVEGLAAHLEAQWAGGASGVLIGGSMGQMQVLRDDTFRTLVRESARLGQGRGELLVGIGDAGYARTKARLEVVLEETRQAPIQGVVAITPYFFKFPQPELIRYYQQLADFSPVPTFIYYLPGVTGATMEIETILELAKHPNISGIKCSCDLVWAQMLKERLAEVRPDFRIIVAQPHLMALLPRIGFLENLDGIFAVTPRLMHKVIHHCAAGEWTEAEEGQALFTQLLKLIASRYGVFPACEVLLQAQGVPGKLASEPMVSLSPERRAELLAEPLVQKILAIC